MGIWGNFVAKGKCGISVVQTCVFGTNGSPTVATNSLGILCGASGNEGGPETGKEGGTSGSFQVGTNCSTGSFHFGAGTKVGNATFSTSIGTFGEGNNEGDSSQFCCNGGCAVGRGRY